jgi:hypothetical protein
MTGQTLIAARKYRGLIVLSAIVSKGDIESDLKDLPGNQLGYLSAPLRATG